MPLIDMLTDISSFNYNKVGKKHDEYFTDDNATGFTPNRETGDNTEYIIGSGNDFNFKTSSTGTDFFFNTNATGFTLNRTEKDIDTDSATFAGEYIIGSSQYESLKNIKSTISQTDPEDLDSNIPKRTTIYFDNEGGINRKDYQLLSTDYSKVIKARRALTEQINIGDTTPKDSKTYISSELNTPVVFSEGHLYGAAPTNVLFEDRLGDVDDQYEKFGGFRGSRASQPGNPGNANDETFGADSPYILKEIGNSDITISPASDGVTDIVFRAARAVTDVVRIGKWTLTPKGIIWNLNQFVLTAQSAIPANRVFNPAGTLGSLVPYVHLPRHTDGTFFDFVEPPSYDVSPNGKNIKIPPKKEEGSGGPFSNLISSLSNFIGLGDGLETNRLEHLLDKRIVNEKEESTATSFVSGLKDQLGLGNDYFNNPPHYNKSTKGPYGKELREISQDGEKLEDKHPNLITNYQDLQKFGLTKPKTSSNKTGIAEMGQSGIDYKEENTPELTVNKIDKYSTVLETNVFSGIEHKDLEAGASNYNLGRGKIKVDTADGTSLYSVGVSNQLQVPYHGQFGKLTTSLDKLPKDFIKFRIRDAVNGKWLIFPAMLGAISDTVTPEYSKERYIGRPDDVHIYNGTSRTVGFDFKVAAFSKQEIPIIQEKMNYLMGLGYPTFKKMLEGDSEERPVAPYIYLTIGDMFNNTPGYFDSIAIATEENGNWEIDEGFQIPMSFNVTVNFVYIGKYLPTTLGKHYEVPWLKDNGAGFGTFNSNPRDGNTSDPNRDLPADSWDSKLPNYNVTNQ